jgi:hypothetical protein
MTTLTITPVTAIGPATVCSETTICDETTLCNDGPSTGTAAVGSLTTTAASSGSLTISPA